jgi:hypothetical protein
MLIAAILLVAVGVCVEFCAMLRAPLGYQDETGFHELPETSEKEVSLPWNTQVAARNGFGEFPVPRC